MASSSLGTTQYRAVNRSLCPFRRRILTAISIEGGTGTVMKWLRSTPRVARLQTFRREEREHLQLLRRKYQRRPDIFSDREVGSLPFFRWLVQTGYIKVG